MRTIIFFLCLIQITFGQTVQLDVIHWNDFHAQNLPFTVRSTHNVTGKDTMYSVSGFAEFSSYVEQYRKNFHRSLLLNGGDDFQGSPISSLTKGASQIRLMNIIQPDAATLGNHEFDYGRPALEANLANARYPIICANLEKNASHETFLKPYLIRKYDSVVVAIIGLITPELAALTFPENIKGLSVTDPGKAIDRFMPEIKSFKPDIIVAVSHMGFYADSLLALQYSELDMIIGGHSHTALFEPRTVNGVIIAQAGSRGRYIGVISLFIDTQRDTIIHHNGSLIECRSADVTPDTAAKKIVSELETTVGAALNVHIADLQTDWIRQGKSESNIGNWITDAYRLFAGADIAVQNAGGIRKDLPAGPVSIRDFWEIAPFGNILVTFTVTGAELLRLVKHQEQLLDDFCLFSGLQYSQYAFKEKKFFTDIRVNGKEIQADSLYTIVTNNFVMEQSIKYFGLDVPKTQVSSLSIEDREVLIQTARLQKKLSSKIEGRIRFISNE